MPTIDWLTPRDREQIRAEWTDRARFLEGDPDPCTVGDNAVTDYDNAMCGVIAAL